MDNRSSYPWVFLVIVAIVVVGGIYWLVSPSSAPSGVATSSGEYPTTVSTGTAGGTAPTTPTVAVASSTRGAILTSSDGRTLYVFKNDPNASSTCTDACATKWPPYMVTSQANVVPNPNTSGTLSTVVRADGSLQVTYNGKPLYFYSQDNAPGDMKGAKISRWSVAKP